MSNPHPMTEGAAPKASVAISMSPAEIRPNLKAVPPTTLVAVLAEDRLLSQALAASIRTASTRVVSAADLTPMSPELSDATAFLVVPGPTPAGSARCWP